MSSSIPKEQALAKPVRYVKGVGPKRSEALLRLGVETVEDLFYYFPRRYEDRSQFIALKDIQPGQFFTVKGEILTTGLKRIKRMTLVEIALGDESGFVYATWFNQPYLKRQFNVGDSVILSGKVELYNSRLQFNSPDYEVLSKSQEDTIHTGRIVPIYPLTEGLGQRGMRRAMKELVDGHAHEINDFFPDELTARLGLVPRRQAIQNVHFPEDADSLDKARRRLIFEEFFVFEIALLKRIRRDRSVLKAPMLAGFQNVAEEFSRQLPFTLTVSQREVLGEIAKDAANSAPMRRLLQGDVGSGKTVVAAFLLVVAARNRYQSVLMAPTEVLADQHYQTLTRLLAAMKVKVALITGSTEEKEKAELLADLRSGRIDIAVGTHALIQEGIRFAKLGAVVIDEQHKFGVRQRAVLLSGELRPHLLVMTATPIPRTLGLTLYGDLDISTIRELPSGRIPVQTFWITKARENEVLLRVKEKVTQGEQAYIVFPLIDETDKMDLQAAASEFEKLRKGIFADTEIGLIHGRLSRWDKERVMRDFMDGRVKVLVSTSLIEVGIDNPNATLMVIEHAERFGLSQLHQLRGRIGRGTKESFCFLFGDPQTEEGKKRLRILTKTTDGFKIAEEDLILRGPGDFLGTRQSGAPLFKIGDLVRDGDLLRLARKEALALIEKDPELLRVESLKSRVEREARQFFHSLKD